MTFAVTIVAAADPGGRNVRRLQYGAGRSDSGIEPVKSRSARLDDLLEVGASSDFPPAANREVFWANNGMASQRERRSGSALRPTQVESPLIAPASRWMPKTWRRPGGTWRNDRLLNERRVGAAGRAKQQHASVLPLDASASAAQDPSLRSLTP